ncbi:hypothetical protein MTP99_008942 [Tenebrio molitor]|jgi:hypothetical protein|nr:hypothetical protein MTP99_008942 [Tenebrio molitor]
MKASTCRVLIILCVTIFVETNGRHHHHETAKDKVANILTKVPEKEQKDFVRYYLHRGYELIKDKETERYPSFHYEMDDDEAILLYEYFATNNRITDDEIVKVGQNVICWNDKCIDISDPGLHP